MGLGLLTVPLLCVCVYGVGSLKPAETHRLQRTEDKLLINEVNADNPGEETSEYVELYHTSGRRVPLDGYYLVFYNGNGNMAYRVENLGGFSTDDQGFFLLGSATIVPRPSVILPKNTIQNGPDAIALYFGGTAFYKGMPITNEGLVDALVYKTETSATAEELVRILTPGVEPFLEDKYFRTTDESLEKCQGEDSLWFFQVGAPTPGLDNHCIPFSQLNASIMLVNEVHVASSSGESEFIELQGPPSTDVKDLVLVLVEGRTQEIYFVMEVRGRTSPDGLLLLGPSEMQSPDLLPPPNSSRPLLRPGVSAVALYRGNPEDVALGTAAPGTSLVDALVYSTAGGADSTLLDFLTRGNPVFSMPEGSRHNGTSANRCVCCSVTRDASAFALGEPTPGKFNSCPKKRFGRDLCFCLQVRDCKAEFPEESKIQVSLAQALDRRCNCGISAAYFRDTVVVCHDNQVDVHMLVLAKSEEQLTSLLQAFAGFLDSQETLQLGGWNGTNVTACLANGTEATPGTQPGTTSEEPRTTKIPPPPRMELLINEVNPDNPGSREDTEYIELFYPGEAPFGLHGYWLVLYNGRNNLAYKVLNLSSYSTDEHGYFLIGSGGVSPRPSILLPDNTIQNGVDAVALYRSSPNLPYQMNMPVTAEGLVDAVVYRSRGSEKADKLLGTLTPGQSVLHEDDSHSSQDESLSRCYSLRGRDHSGFQVTEITPLRENACRPIGTNSTKGGSLNHSLFINELSLANETVLYQFIELKGDPGLSLEGYKLVFFSGHDTEPYSSIRLQGTLGSNGLFVVRAGQPRAGKEHEQLVVPSDWRGPSVQEETHSVAVVGSGVRTLHPPSDQDVEDAVTFAWETRGNHRGHPEAVQIISKKTARTLSLSRCSACGETYVPSEPSPGLENSCPRESLSVHLEMCLLTHNCSMWPPSPLVKAHLQQALADSMEESCSCGVSPCFLQGLNFTCSNSILELSGQVWARSPEQRQLLIRWDSSVSVSSYPLPVSGKLLKAAAACSSPAKMKPRSAAVFNAWKITLTALGAFLLAVVLISMGFYCIKRKPQSYTTIEMNDRCEIMADII